MSTTLEMKLSGGKGATNDGSSVWSGMQKDFKSQQHLRPSSAPSSVRTSSQLHASYKTAPAEAPRSPMTWRLPVSFEEEYILPVERPQER